MGETTTMMRIRFQPSGVTTRVSAGKTLLDAAMAAGVEIETVCGGRGTCAKCRVIATGGLAAPTHLEVRGLTPEELQRGYRLACQAVIVSDVDVIVPEESRVSRVSILSQGADRDAPLDPWVCRHTLTLPEPSLADASGDLERLQRAWRAARSCEMPPPSLGALQDLPHAARAGDGRVTLIVADAGAPSARVLRIVPVGAATRLLGIAFDIGTTTVVGYLVDLDTGERLAVSSQLNPQTRYGDDVISRIDHAGRTPDGLAALQREVIGALNAIINATAREAGVDAGDIMAVTTVGNTTMMHLLLAVSPAAMAQAPYVPAITAAVPLSAATLGLATHPEARVWALPSIAGWVGADTVGMLLATGAHRERELTLAIDIGTNGEMAMGSRERMVTCSTAAGPAFEGAHLSCGMRAADGAIDRVRIDGEVHLHTIGESAPRGVCGSGLVDLVAEMLRSGVLDATGMMQPADALAAGGQPALAARVSQNGRQRSFALATHEEGAGGRPVLVSQRDVRELQLAKGAIRAGIEILMRELGISAEDVRIVYLAGAFGNYIAPESALTIGLMPRFPHARIVPVGNAAGSGARMALVSRAALAEATRIAERVEYLELSGRPDFQDQFAASMVF